jgi:hypothetical protein
MGTERTAAATAARARKVATAHDATMIGCFVAGFVSRLKRGPLYLKRDQVIEMLNEAARSLRPGSKVGDA